MADETSNDSKLVNAGRRPEWRGRTVNPPVHRGSTILFDSVADLRSAAPGLGSFVYGLQGSPTHWALSEALTALEPGAAGTCLMSSGLGAVTVALLTVLKAGDELLMVDNAYGPTRRLCDTILARFGVTTRYYDPLATPGDIDAMIGPATRCIMLESPGSLTFEVQDVPGICAVAARRGVTTILDNSWATPLLFPAIAAGIDLTVVALTKHVGGHSDLLLGAVTANDRWFARLERTTYDLGQAVSPDDAWLAARGLRTLGVRLRRHEESGLKVAAWLNDQPWVERLLHPAFPDCPGHEYWKRDFAGSSGVFAFALKNWDSDRRDAFIDRLKLFSIGFSWGGYESLVVPAEAERSVSAAPAQALVRLHIGLEDVDELIADLAQAFEG